MGGMFHYAHLCVYPSLLSYPFLEIEMCLERAGKGECSFPDKYCALSLSPLDYSLHYRAGHKPAISRPHRTERALRVYRAVESVLRSTEIVPLDKE